MAGRPRFKPTKAHRDLVRLLKADDLSNERIAAQIGISRNTLEQYFGAELEFGADQVRAETLLALDKAVKRGNASAIRMRMDRLDARKLARPDQPLKEPKLGKKEQQQAAAEHPDTSTAMGDLIARRMAATKGSDSVN